MTFKRSDEEPSNFSSKDIKSILPVTTMGKPIGQKGFILSSIISRHVNNCGCCGRGREQKTPSTTPRKAYRQTDLALKLWSKQAVYSDDQLGNKRSTEKLNDDTAHKVIDIRIVD